MEETCVLWDNNRMKNIILIGMSGAGKSTLGVLLAKAMNYDFMDTDLILQTSENRLLQEIIEQDGVQTFKAIEERIICDLQADHSIIATGGSVIYSERGMECLKRLGHIVYLHVPYTEIKRRLHNIHSRGIVIEEGQTLESLYLEREVLYRRYCDFLIDVGELTIEQTIDIMMDQLEDIE